MFTQRYLKCSCPPWHDLFTKWVDEPFINIVFCFVLYLLFPQQWVGSSCGLHGPYIFYKAFKFNRDGKPRILSLGDFFFVRCKPEDPICIAELQLLWEERTSEQLLSSSKLYFLPEDTPQGRTVTHGEVGLRTAWRIHCEWLLMLVFLFVPCLCPPMYHERCFLWNGIKSGQRMGTEPETRWIRAVKGVCSRVLLQPVSLLCVNCWMCTCPAALNKAAAALYGVNCVIKGKIRKNPASRRCHFISWRKRVK